MLYRTLFVCVCFLVHIHALRHHDARTKGQSAAASHASTLTGSNGASGPVTHTPFGVIRGSWMESRRGRRFESYRGIRYAEPPVGELRFQPPKPILNYNNEVDASEEGPACPLKAQPTYYMDEDCLRINVYTPKSNSSKLLPVIFFIHPGGFYSMTGRSDLVGPHYLLDRDVVLVSINYRLQSLGFLSTGDELAPGNNGFKDQVAALRWVRRNIASFGGDPNLVTIAGCSAGSTSVMLHMISPMSKGLFHRAISMSGSPTRKVPSPHHQRDLAVRQAELLNCPTNSTKAIMDCLKTKPWRDLGNSILGFFEFGFDPLTIWAPVVEPDFGQERFLPTEPMDAIRQGKIHSVPFIVSQTEAEFFWKAFTILKNETLLKTMNSEWERIAPISFILPRENASVPANRLRQAYLGGRQLANDEQSAINLGQLYSDGITRLNIHRMANLMCRHSQHAVYYYMFSYFGNHSRYEDPKTGKPTAAAHHDDMIYLFWMSSRFPMIPVDDSLDSHMVDKMTAIWYNFAKFGDPNPRGDLPELASLSWPVMTPDDRKYLRIDKEFSVHNNLYEDRLKIWEELYPIQY